MGVIVHQIMRRASGLCAALDSALNTVSSVLNSFWQQLRGRSSCSEENSELWAHLTASVDGHFARVRDNHVTRIVVLAQPLQSALTARYGW
jgi:hypothetical protein